MTGMAWIVSYVLLWAAVLVLGVAVVVLLRHIGVLHTRMGPQGVHDGGEGPVVGAPAPAIGWFEYGGSPLTVVAFTSATCELCQTLRPSLVRLAKADPRVRIEFVEHADDTVSVFRGWSVSQTPYVAVVDEAGIVRGAGIANSLEQVEVLVDAVSEGPIDAR